MHCPGPDGDGCQNLIQGVVEDLVQVQAAAHRGGDGVERVQFSHALSQGLIGLGVEPGVLHCPRRSVCDSFCQAEVIVIEVIGAGVGDGHHSPYLLSDFQGDADDGPAGPAFVGEAVPALVLLHVGEEDAHPMIQNPATQAIIEDGRDNLDGFLLA